MALWGSSPLLVSCWMEEVIVTFKPAGWPFIQFGKYTSAGRLFVPGILFQDTCNTGWDSSLQLAGEGSPIVYFTSAVALVYMTCTRTSECFALHFDTYHGWLMKLAVLGLETKYMARTWLNQWCNFLSSSCLCTSGTPNHEGQERFMASHSVNDWHVRWQWKG